ncbi:MAG TPA: DUF6194 family protein [Phototrophicaceae bacterium]|nr:DUF6194 family protein [Phototrophicaceae bacterium]
MMSQAEWEAFIAGLDKVEREENYGYSFFFVGADHRLGFVTIANSDNDYDRVSNLDRDGVFRLNIGLSRDSFDELVGSVDPANVDYTALNVVMPHPEYAKQNFICILNPSGDNEALTKELIVEAHEIAARRIGRKTKP